MSRDALRVRVRGDFIEAVPIRHARGESSNSGLVLCVKSGSLCSELGGAGAAIFQALPSKSHALCVVLELLLCSLCGEGGLRNNDALPCRRDGRIFPAISLQGSPLHEGALPRRCRARVGHRSLHSCQVRLDLGLDCSSELCGCAFTFKAEFKGVRTTLLLRCSSSSCGSVSCSRHCGDKPRAR